jgi:hypothetical protein
MASAPPPPSGALTTTIRYTKGAFLVTGEDIEARTFASRREAKDWCVRL